MYIIQTAKASHVSVYLYLSALIENKNIVKDQPQLWLQWNYLQRLAQFKSAVN